jgi:hypothetical protein
MAAIGSTNVLSSSMILEIDCEVALQSTWTDRARSVDRSYLVASKSVSDSMTSGYFGLILFEIWVRAAALRWCFR